MSDASIHHLLIASGVVPFPFAIIDSQSHDTIDSFMNVLFIDMITGLKVLYAKKKVPEKFIVSHEVACLLGTLIHDERIYQLIEKKKGATNMSDYVLGIRKKGRNEGIMTTLIKQLNQKFGNLSKETIKEIKRSNKKQLNSLTLHIFDIEKEEDIKKILLGK